MTVPSYKSFQETKTGGVTAVSSITIDKPDSTVENDLLIAVISNSPGETATLSGWTIIQSQPYEGLGLQTFYKVAGAAEGDDYTFTFSGNCYAYAAIIRITGHDTSTPINISGTRSGFSASPTCSSTNTTKDDCLILRVFAADKSDITIDDGEPSGTTVVTVDTTHGGGLYGKGHYGDGLYGMTGGGRCSAGVAYASQGASGATGTAAFALTASRSWLASTIAIQAASAVSASVSASISASPSISASVSASKSASVSASISASMSFSSSPSASISSSISASASASISASVSASLSASISASSSASISPSVSASPSISASISASYSTSPSASPSISASVSASVSASASISASVSASPSASPSAIDGSGWGTYESGGTVQWVEKKFTNLGHLEGETVIGQATGVDDVTAEIDEQVVDSDGDIMLDNYKRKAVIGLSYRYALRPMRFAVMTSSGTIMTSKVNIHEIIVSLYKSAGVQYGDSLDNLHPVNFDDDNALYTGDKVLAFEGGFNTENDIFISGNGPFACTVRAIIARVDKTSP